MSVCQYSDVFGKPREGVHAHRTFFDIAAVDFYLTFVLAYVIQITYNVLTNKSVAYRTVLGLTFFLGIVLHRLFCVRTTVDRMLFG
jgi:hypothetical protein